MITFSFIFALMLAGTTPESPPPPPNILWILGEDLGPELSSYGTMEVDTPVLDELARRGMRFTRAFTTSPVCSPSRSAFHTGMYQMSIGAHNHRSHRENDPSPYPFPLPEGVRLITDWLRHAGYFTGNIRHFPDALDLSGSGKTDWNFTYQGDPFDTDQWSDLKNHQPFFAEVNFPETHRGNAWDSAHERIPQPAHPDRVVIPPYYPDHPVVREDWAQYLNAVMSLDQKVGKVLGQLEADGLADNTIVIFMGDHGRAMLRGKQWPYDSGLHVPLIIYWPEAHPPPEGYAASTVSDQLISAIDVTATTMALAGITRPEKMHGRVFLGKQSEPPRLFTFGGRDRGDETIDRIRTVRSHRYRYIKNYYPHRPFLQTNRYKEDTYPTYWVMKQLHQNGELNETQSYLMNPTRPAEELYDLSVDPHEINNLASSEAHQEILTGLRQELHRWQSHIGDLGHIPEHPAVYEFYEQRAIDRYGESIEAKRKKWLDG